MRSFFLSFVLLFSTVTYANESHCLTDSLRRLLDDPSAKEIPAGVSATQVTRASSKIGKPLNHISIRQSALEKLSLKKREAIERVKLNEQKAARAKLDSKGLQMMTGSAEPIQLSARLKDGLEKAYQKFLKIRKADAPEHPVSIKFNGQDYKVIDYLGRGGEGFVWRVEDQSGKTSVLKTPRDWSDYLGLKGSVRETEKMNQDHPTSPKLMGYDTATLTIQLQDVRGIPLADLPEMLSSAGLSQSEIDDLFTAIRRREYDYSKIPDRNQILDLDRQIVVPIDAR